MDGFREIHILGDAGALVALIAAPWSCDHVNGALDEAHRIARSLVDRHGHAARRAGWVVDASSPADLPLRLPAERSPTGVALVADDWEEACELSGLDPEAEDPTCHTVVTGVLARELHAKGEVVTSLGGIEVWTRPASRSRSHPRPWTDPVLAEVMAQPPIRTPAQ